MVGECRYIFTNECLGENISGIKCENPVGPTASLTPLLTLAFTIFQTNMGWTGKDSRSVDRILVYIFGRRWNYSTTMRMWDAGVTDFYAKSFSGFW